MTLSPPKYLPSTITSGVRASTYKSVGTNMFSPQRPPGLEVCRSTEKREDAEPGSRGPSTCESEGDLSARMSSYKVKMFIRLRKEPEKKKVTKRVPPDPSANANHPQCGGPKPRAESAVLSQFWLPFCVVNFLQVILVYSLKIRKAGERNRRK